MDESTKRRGPASPIIPDSDHPRAAISYKPRPPVGAFPFFLPDNWIDETSLTTRECGHNLQDIQPQSKSEENDGPPLKTDCRGQEDDQHREEPPSPVSSTSAELRTTVKCVNSDSSSMASLLSHNETNNHRSKTSMIDHDDLHNINITAQSKVETGGSSQTSAAGRGQRLTCRPHHPISDSPLYGLLTHRSGPGEITAKPKLVKAAEKSSELKDASSPKLDRSTRKSSIFNYPTAPVRNRPVRKLFHASRATSLNEVCVPK